MKKLLTVGAIFSIAAAIFFFSIKPELDGKAKKIPNFGERVLTGKPGEIYVLPDDETHIVFDSQYAPSIHFGEIKNPNDPDTINYLDLENEMMIQNKGNVYNLKSLGCKIEKRYTDVEEDWITSCDVQFKSQPAKKPVDAIDFKPFKQDFSLGAAYNSAFRKTEKYPASQFATRDQTLLQEPFLKVFATPIEIYHYNFDKPPSTVFKAGPPIIWFVSAYGSKKIQFNDAEEIWDKKSKSIDLGAFKINTKIENYECKELYIESWKGYTSSCTNITLAFDVIPNSDYHGMTTGLRILDFKR